MAGLDPSIRVHRDPESGEWLCPFCGHAVAWFESDEAGALEGICPTKGCGAVMCVEERKFRLCKSFMDLEDGGAEEIEEPPF